MVSDHPKRESRVMPPILDPLWGSMKRIFVRILPPLPISVTTTATALELTAGIGQLPVYISLFDPSSQVQRCAPELRSWERN